MSGVVVPAQVSELWEFERAHGAWFEAHVRPSMPPGATPDITFRPITKTATRD